jgi:type I restriction enzyme S subunit
MIEGLKPYPEYKESGQKWLGGVPAHWDLKPGHAAFAKRNESNCGMREKTVLSLSYGRIKVKATDKQHGLVPESYETYQVVNEGNVIIRGTDLQNDHTSLRIGLSRNRGIISSAYLCLEAQPSITPEYGYQILNVFDLTKAIYRYGSGLRQNLDHGEIKRLPIFLPPLDEQSAIVRFLDHANRKIDGFIRAKRKLIGLLNEQKQAIIHRAVTRGLQPDVPLKPSGIPRLGDIPMHWDVMRVKQCARKISKGTTPSTEGRAILESGPVLFLKAENISAGCITDKPLCFIDEETYRVIRRSQLANNDILFVIAGATLGKTSVVSGEVLPANTNQAVAFIRPNSRVVPRFLELWLQSPRIKELIWLNAVQSAQPNLSMADLGNFVTPVPPPNEQQEILNFVKEATKPMSDAIARTEREIALMQEYRARLTADLVTGKLDVREAAAKLPDPPVDAPAEPGAVETLDVFEETDDLEETPAKD